jgi:hypothetical protein
MLCVSQFRASGKTKLPVEAEMSDETEIPAEVENRPAKVLSPEAQRALAEAEARRNEIDAATAMAPKEKGGRGGLEPSRYGDWEIKGLTSDF